MPQDAADRTTAARKAAFVRTMLNHPERLKGKTVEEAYAGMRRQVGHMTEASGGNRNSPNFIGPKSKAAYNGQDTATASGGKRNTRATGLLGGPDAKMGPVPTKGAVDRRLKNNANRGQFGTPTVRGMANKADQAVNKSGYGVSTSDAVKGIGNTAKKVANAVTKRRGF